MFVSRDIRRKFLAKNFRGLEKILRNFFVSRGINIIHQAYEYDRAAPALNQPHIQPPLLKL
ncbi:MAG: hypothetical protein RL536_668 [Candidatus Parcubacteria bacterium]